MEKDKQLVYNAVKCLSCNKVIQSKFGHDYVECGCPNRTMVDGGLGYQRYGGVNLDLVESVSLYSDDPIELIREVMVWGKNYSKEGELLPQTEWIKIKGLAQDHLEALIPYTVGRWPNGIFHRELEYRKNNYDS